MRTDLSVTAPLGDLVVAVYDNAAEYSNDPREVSTLANATVEHMLRHAQQASGTLAQVFGALGAPDFDTYSI